MSGPSDLARLSDTIDKANELLLSDQIKIMDVGDGVQRPTNAKVLADLSIQMSGAMIYLTTAAGLAGTVAGSFFSVLSVTAAGYVDLYQNVAGAAVFKKSYPSTEAVAAIDAVTQANVLALANLNKLVQDFPTESAEAEIQVITDPEGGVFSTLTNRRLQTIPFDIISEPGQTSIGDGEGAALIYADDERMVIGELEMQHTPSPGIYFTDAEGGVLPLDAAAPSEEERSPFDGGLLFSPIIATSELHDSRIYVSGLLPRRAQSKEVSVTIASTTAAESQTGEMVSVSAARLGAQAVLNVRSLAEPDKRKFLPVTLKHVPLQSVPSSPKILFIGDSIGARQGAFLLKGFLEELGFTPKFIGTIQGSKSPTDIWNNEGPLGECRSGWRSGDFTYSYADRAVIVEPGGEAAYLALDVLPRRERNVFLRLATGADSAAVIRNGYVFDPAFYQARFSLETPDIVINALGTNDAALVPVANIYAEVLNNDKLIHSQLKAAWPLAKIIRTLPTNAISAVHNTRWETQFTPVIAAMKDAAVAVANSRLTIAPLWAMTNAESGYDFSQVTPDADGFYPGNWTDGTHPIGSSRAELYRTMAPYVAAAALNLI